MFYKIIENYCILMFPWFLLYMYTNIAKNPLKTFLGLNRESNKKIKASPKKRSSYKKKSVSNEQKLLPFHSFKEKAGVGANGYELLDITD